MRSNINGKNKIILVVILAVIFGIAGGVVGELIARAYVFENTFNIPLFGEINFAGNNFGGSNLIIRGAKKVVVEQDDKINGIIDSLGGSIVGFFKKRATSSTFSVKKTAGLTVSELLTKKWLSGSYGPGDEVANGFIITSDGWIITDFTPPELKGVGPLKAVVEKIKKNVVQKYVVISRNRTIYSVDDIVFDKLSGYSFWHIGANDLPVRRFAEAGEIHNGQFVLAVNWRGWTYLSSVAGRSSAHSSLIRSSDNYTEKIILNQSPRKEFYGSYLFNLNGDLVGLIGSDGSIDSVGGLTPIIKSLLQYKAIKRASLGLNFIDLSDFIFDSDLKQVGGAKRGALIAADAKGVAVVRGGAADKAGLKENDIIIEIDNIKINHDNGLDDIISHYLAGDKIKVVYLRGGDKKEANIELQKL